MYNSRYKLSDKYNDLRKNMFGVSILKQRKYNITWNAISRCLAENIN